MKQTKMILYACIEKNIGDDLFIKTVCNRYPDVQFSISSSANYGDLCSIPNLKFRYSLKLWNMISNSRRNNAVAIILKKIVTIIMHLIYGNYKASVYIVGNAFKNTNYVSSSQIEWLKYRISLTNHFYIISTNFGPYSDENWEKDCIEAFKTVDDICFRDKYSYSIFKTLSNSRYAPDAVLSMGRQYHSGNEYVLLSVIDASMKNRGAEINAARISYEKSIAGLVDFYINAGKKVCLIASNTEQDLPCINRILDQITVERDNIDLCLYNGSFNVVDKYYRNADIVIGTRLHTIILGWLYGVSVIPIIYDIKVGEMLKSYGYAGLCFDLLNMDECSGETIQKSLPRCYMNNLDQLISQSHDQFKLLDKEIGIK